MNSAARYHGGWAFRRIEKLKDAVGMYATTREVRDSLRITERRLRYWAADPYFKAAQIAIIPAGKSRLVWHLDRLFLWLLAIGKVKHKLSGFAQNPPESGEATTREQAREQLGIPTEYTFKPGE